MISATAEIKVLLVDDHPVVRQGIRDMLQSYEDISVVGDAGDPSSALQAARRLSPDVILLDNRMPQAIGIRLANELRGVHEPVKIIMLTAFDDDDSLYGALRHGVDGYLLKTIASEDLVRAIREVMKGEKVVGPSLSRRVIDRVRVLEEEQRRHESGLTEQDLQILSYIAEGLMTPEIAKRIFLSEITVKRRVSEIMSKLGAHNRAHAASEAIRRGLI